MWERFCKTLACFPHAAEGESELSCRQSTRLDSYSRNPHGWPIGLMPAESGRGNPLMMSHPHSSSHDAGGNQRERGGRGMLEAVAREPRETQQGNRSSSPEEEGRALSWSSLASGQLLAVDTTIGFETQTVGMQCFFLK